jgi:putative toxin-antitoxin system antitoxin component (TIGR02293 family)
MEQTMAASKPAIRQTARQTTRNAPAPAITKGPVRKTVTLVPKATGQWLAFSKAVGDEEPTRRIHRIRTGAKASYMIGAANALGVSRETVFGLVGLPTSTANRKIANDETLEIPVTERLARLAVIGRHAEETFGDAKAAREWLLADNTSLGGCTPLSLLDTDVGTREVAKTLVAISYGGVV